jgi:[acyl-carrier-protein] S-malonyltransferase
MLAILAPGQGSQTPNLFQTWITDNKNISNEFKAGLTELIQNLGDHNQLDLIHLGNGADDNEIRTTNNAQPLLFASGLIGFLELFESLEIPSEILDTSEILYAGHSVGEVLAFALAGKISVDAAFEFVTLRGRQMHEATTLAETGMAAVLGGDRAEVVEALTKLNLTPANENGGGQIVAAGLLSDINKLVENPPNSVRIRPLAVAGAFHTKYMEIAQTSLRELANSIAQSAVKENSTLLLTNKDGQVVKNSLDYLNLLVGQVASPVRWDLTMEKMLELGVTGVIELPPAGVLSGLVKRCMPGVEIFTMKSPDELNLAREFAIKHAPNLANTLGKVK